MSILNTMTTPLQRLTSNSQYWKDMHIERSVTNISPTVKILSKDEPIQFDKEYSELKLECHYPYTQSDHDKYSSEIIKFVNTNNQMYTGVYELIDEKLLNTFVGFETYMSIIRYKKNNNIMGVMFAIICNTTALNTTKFALTSYLCIHKKLRGKGLCMMLIRYTLKEAHNRNLYCSYYLQEKAFSGCALSVERWMRPINLESAIKKGFEFELPPKSNKTKRKYAYMIKNSLPKEYSYNVIQTNKEITKSFKFVNELNSTLSAQQTSRLSWKPTKKEWKSWCKSDAFDTLTLIKNNKTIGVITIQKKQIFITETQCVANLTFIPYHLADISCDEFSYRILLESAIMYSKDLGVDMLFAFESGVFSKDVIQTNNFVTTGNMYIDFYNYRNSLTVSDVFVPLL